MTRLFETIQDKISRDMIRLDKLIQVETRQDMKGQQNTILVKTLWYYDTMRQYKTIQDNWDIMRQDKLRQVETSKNNISQNKTRKKCLNKKMTGLVFIQG